MKRKVELDELVDAQVSFLSLVDAGANRAPFKIQKAESDEGDTMSLHFKDIFKDEPFEPRVLAVAVSPDADLEKAKRTISKAGLSTEKQCEIDGAVIFEQGDGVGSARGSLVKAKVSDEIVAVVDVAKSFSPFSGSTDFSTNLQGLAFLPSLEVSLDALRTTIFESLSGGRQDAVDHIAAAGTEFATHLSELAKGLPDEVFKLEQYVEFDADDPDAEERAGVDSGSNPDADLTAGEEASESQSASEVEKDAGSAVDTEATAHSLEATEDTDSPATEGSGPVKSVTKEDLDSAISGFRDTLVEMLKPLSERLAAVEKQATTAVEKADAADAAVTGRVLGAANDDGDGRRAEVTYTEPPLMDSGMEALSD